MKPCETWCGTLYHPTDHDEVWRGGQMCYCSKPCRDEVARLVAYRCYGCRGDDPEWDGKHGISPDGWPCINGLE